VSTPTDSHRPAASVPPWCGWVRPAGSRAWKRVCEGDTEGGCWGKLLGHDAGQHSEKLVLPGHKNPNERNR
jgi:hypothetical protein